MKLTQLLSLLILLLMGCSQIQSQGFQQQDDVKYLIIHADDLGVGHSVNRASINALENGWVSSASIMVPCPWFPEIARWAKDHPEMDLGLHLTLTAEWQDYKWSGCESKHNIAGLINDRGYFYDNTADVSKYGSPEEVELELRAQIEKAQKAGINITHLDSHMGALFNPKFLPVYLKVGKAYDIPVMLSRDFAPFIENIDDLKPSQAIVLDKIEMAQDGQSPEKFNDLYASTLRNLKPGITELIVHLAYDDDEMKAMAIDHPDYGSAWRQADLDFLRSDACKQILEEEKIQLVTYKELSGK